MRRMAALMGDSTHGLIQALFHMVWADGVVSPEEVEALTSILKQFGFSLADIICLLDQHLSEPPEDLAPVRLDEWFESRDDQKRALLALMKVCFSTGSIDAEQIGYIEGLVVRMGLSAQELEELRQMAMGSAC